MDTKLTTHGLDGAMVEPDWTPLTLEEVRTVLSRFPGAGTALRIATVSPRPFSAASVVETDRQRVFVKRHSCAVRDAAGLLEEHRFMAHLRRNGAPVPAVFETDTGLTALECGPWTYEVHGVPEGVDLYEEAISWSPFQTLEHARSAGAMLAQLHMAVETYQAPARRVQPLVASFTIFASQNSRYALDRYLAARPVLSGDANTRRDCEEALGLLAPFHDELLPLLPSLQPIWTHNDLHASNLFWSDTSDRATTTGVIDFGLADRTNAVYDLAQTIERNIVEWLMLMQDPTHPDDVPVHLDHLIALLDGYESVRVLSADEAAALAPMTALCHAEFALTEADYFLAVLRSEKRAQVATHDYLVGHAEWFSTAGRRLLEPIRRWAVCRHSVAVIG